MNLIEIEKRIRELDQTALSDFKSGKAESPILYKAQGLIKSAKDMIFVASEESPDRYGDIIQVAGWNFDNFKKNPVFMFNHDYHIAPIGTVPKIWVEGKQLLNNVEWDTADELAKFIKGKYDRGILRGESVGFRPLEWEEGKDGGYIFSKAELLEISAVALPAHPNAIRKALENQKSYYFIPVPESLISEPAKGKEKMMNDDDMQSMKEKMGQVKGHMEEMSTLMDDMMGMMSNDSEEEGKDGKKGQGKETDSETEEKSMSELLDAIREVKK